jgi:hypothetical protein
MVAPLDVPASAFPPAMRYLSALAALGGSLGLSVLAACSDPTGPNSSGIDPVSISRVVVTPTIDTLRFADTVTAAAQRQLQAAVELKTGQVRTDVRFVWESSDPSVAVVDTTGLVIARSEGTTRIRVSAGKAADATIVVERVQAATLAVSPTTVRLIEGESTTITATALDAAGARIPGVVYTFTSSDPARATVTSTGAVQLAPNAGAGSVTITVTAAGRTARTTIDVVRRAFAVAASAAPASAAGVVAGGDFSCGRLVLDRGAYCWGRNEVKQLGTTIRDTVCTDDIENFTRRVSTPCALEPARQTTPPRARAARRRKPARVRTRYDRRRLLLGAIDHRADGHRQDC